MEGPISPDAGQGSSKDGFRSTGQGNREIIFSNFPPAIRLGKKDSVRAKEIRVELLADLHHLLATETVAGSESGDFFEVVVLSTRQGPVEHARRCVADVLEAMHHVARDEDDSAQTDRRSLATDGQLIGALDDEEHLFLAEMDVVGRAFTGFVPRHEDRDGAAGGLSGKQYFHVEAEGL